jgi:ATP-dependent Clp protease ATP-binding subunit ClpC
MFERYTEKARRVIFFARYEASQFGSPYIETEHLLLGLLREDKQLAELILRGGTTEEFIRGQIEKLRPPGEKIPTSIDMPLSQESKRVLILAAEEAERLLHKHIGTEHLLLGLAAEGKSVAATILREAGLELAGLRDEITRVKAPTPASEHLRLPPLLAELSRDLTDAALRNELDPLIGRTAEFDRMIQILCRSGNNNLALLGEAGVGKQAAVEGLACRIAAGEIPERLEGMHVVQIVLSPILAILRETPRVQDRLKEVLDGLANPAKTIYSVEGLFDISAGGSVELARLLRQLLTMGDIQCIGLATRGDFQKAAEKEPWLQDSFRAVELPAPSVSEAIQILFAARPRYERFHSVKYTDEALKQAVTLSQRFLPDCLLPDIAIDMIDDAGAACTVRQGSIPEEVRAVQQRLKVIKRDMEKAIGDHRFEEAKALSEEEVKAREE